MSDITIVYLTINRMPPTWVEYHTDCLVKAAGDAPIISISRVPMDLGTNVIQEEPFSYMNIYKQLLRGAKMADTPFIGVAEDDVLYHSTHYTCFRPENGEVSYNLARWSVFSWDPQFYSLRLRVANFALIAPRDYLIAALEERFARWGDDWPLQYTGEVGRGGLETGLQVSRRKCVEFYSPVPLIQLSHPKGLEERQQKMRKSHGMLKAYDIPHWGKASEIARYHNA